MSSNTLQKQNGNTAMAEQRQATVVRKFSPAVDILETADELSIVAEVPGATADGIDVRFERGVLTIEAAVRPRGGQGEARYLLREYGVGHFQRSFEINDQIDANKIAAKIENGVLTITLPKAEAARPKKITVQSA